MKKILLCGATHGSNFGDSLFAYMFKKKVENESKELDIYFTKASEYSKKTLDIKVAGIKELFQMDALVYISGGYFGQSHEENLKGSLYRFLTYFVYGLMMILRRKPIVILGVGAGPLNRKFLRKTAVFIFNKAKIVAVRDEQSKDYMRKYGVTSNMVVTSDSAQVINKKEFDVKSKDNWTQTSTKLSNKYLILVHLASKHAGLYNEVVIETLIESLSNREDIGYILTTDYVTDGKALNDLYKKFPKERTEIYSFYDPIEFVELISNVDAAVTPKLHVGILASTYNKSVISFPLHPGKTLRYYEQIGYPERCKSLFEINKEDVHNMVLNSIFTPIELNKEIRESSSKNFELLAEFLKRNS